MFAGRSFEAYSNQCQNWHANNYLTKDFFVQAMRGFQTIFLIIESQIVCFQACCVLFADADADSALYLPLIW